MDLWIRQQDWCSSEPDTTFIQEKDIDDCAIEKIITNRFLDPLIGSDSDNDDERPFIDWNKVFVKSKNETITRRVYVAGTQFTPKHPKLSILNKHQQYCCLKILCGENRNVLPAEFMQRTTNYDLQMFEQLKEAYLKEQKEYIEWARTLWTTSHCVRALRPDQLIEEVYEAEFNMKAHELGCFPKNYTMAAHIPIYNTKSNCEIFAIKDLVTVNMSDIPKVELPALTRKVEIMKDCSLPKPCKMHPCMFVLPQEKTLTVLPLTEIHRELAQYATDNSAGFIASESALKCLVETDRHWMIPLSVCRTMNEEGVSQNVLVLGSEFSLNKKPAMSRTYRAFRHLLANAFTTKTDLNRSKSTKADTSNVVIENINNTLNEMDMSSDDEDQLVINEDEDNDEQITEPTNNTDTKENNDSSSSPAKKVTRSSSTRKSESYSNEKETDCQENDEIPAKRVTRSSSLKQSESSSSNDKDHSDINVESGNQESSDNVFVSGDSKTKDDFYCCNCKEYNPPPRSFRKWCVKNNTSHENFDLIVHCSHKTKTDTEEVIMEPIPEYQLDLGGSKQSDHKIKTLALSLLLRNNASLLNVRLSASEGETGQVGEVITIDNLTREEFSRQHGDFVHEIANIISESLSQLQGLLPGNYVLQHEPSHGSNALLYATNVNNAGDKLSLTFDCEVLTEADEARIARTPPELAPVLLPLHKYRKVLPCAFTPFPYMVAKETKKPPTKLKTPPQAIRGGGSGLRGKWPKKKKKRGRRNNVGLEQ